VSEAGVQPAAAASGADFAEPFRRFGELLERAVAAGLPEPTAMALATATAEGRPSVRMVLLKGHDERGFVFYTNLESRKARELAGNPYAALCFHWVAMEVQVGVEWRRFAVATPGFAVRVDGTTTAPAGYRWLDAEGRVVHELASASPTNPGARSGRRRTRPRRKASPVPTDQNGPSGRLE
jgi:hypothetical protein